MKEEQKHGGSNPDLELWPWLVKVLWWSNFNVVVIKVGGGKDREDREMGGCGKD